MTPLTRPRSAIRPVLVLLALAAALALGGCGSAGATPTPTFGPVVLDGTQWVLLNYSSPTGTVVTVPMAVTPTAKFSGGQFSGFAGCNTFSGPYTQDGATIAIGPLGGTKVACDQPLLVVEAAYVDALAAVDKAEAAGNTLRLTETGGFSALEFVRATN